MKGDVKNILFKNTMIVAIGQPTYAIVGFQPHASRRIFFRGLVGFAGCGWSSPEGAAGLIMPGSNMPMATVGVFLLWLGWFGFNGAVRTRILITALIPRVRVGRFRDRLTSGEYRRKKRAPRILIQAAAHVCHLLHDPKAFRETPTEHFPVSARQEETGADELPRSGD